MERLWPIAVVEYHIETPGQCHDKFTVAPVCMATTFLTSGYIVNPIGTRNFKRYMRVFLSKRKIAALVYYFRQFDDSGFFH